MSATDATLPYPAPPAGRGSRAGSVRLLRLELRHSPMLWMAPIFGALFYFTAYRQAIALPAFWEGRAIRAAGQGVGIFAPFVAGAAAWIGSRDGRRATCELVAATARSRWSTRVAAWMATTCWATVIYLVCIGVVYGVTATQANWGGPPLWPVVVGVSAVAALTAIGFAAGAILPSRFTAPLAAAIALLVVLAGHKVAFNPFSQGLTSSPYALLIQTTNYLLPPDAGLYFGVQPGLEIVQAMLLAGLAVTALGALGLPATAGGRWSRRAAALLTVLGLAGVGTAVGLVGTARVTGQGVEIPALYSKADAQPIPYTPTCSHTAAIPVCVHPAFKPYLSQITAALAPLLREVAGLPVRADQIADPDLDGATPCSPDFGGSLSGTPPVFHVFFSPPNIDGLTAGFISVRVRGLTSDCGVDPAQQSIRAALLKDAGLLSLDPVVQSSGGLPASARAAAMRFASLPPATRHAWLQTHLAALAAGRLTSAQIP